MVQYMHTLYCADRSYVHMMVQYMHTLYCADRSYVHMMVQYMHTLYCGDRILNCVEDDFAFLWPVVYLFMEGYLHSFESIRFKYTVLDIANSYSGVDIT
jgi:1-deoxy-D-xylulose 5-phosphate reductoisomerase